MFLTVWNLLGRNYQIDCVDQGDCSNTEMVRATIGTPSSCKYCLLIEAPIRLPMPAAGISAKDFNLITNCFSASSISASCRDVPSVYKKTGSIAFNRCNSAHKHPAAILGILADECFSQIGVLFPECVNYLFVFLHRHLHSPR